MKIGHYMPAYRNQPNGEASDTMIASQVWALQNDHDFDRNRSVGMPLDQQRNKHGVKWSRERGHDLLMMQDADCWTDPKAGPVLFRMLKSMREHDAAVVVAVFQCRTPTADGMSRPNCFPVKPGEVYEAETIGSGLMLIDMNKLAELPMPWFTTILSEDGTEVVCGEDVFFGRLCKQHGHTVIVDWTIPTYHGIDLGLSNTPPAPPADEDEDDAEPGTPDQNVH